VRISLARCLVRAVAVSSRYAGRTADQLEHGTE